LYRPHFIKLILDSNDKTIKQVEATSIRSDFVDDYNLEVVRQGMRDAVNYGSARSLSTLPVQAAGKTGTAQWSTKKDNHAWFTGFAPYDNPEIVITVLVEEGGEGSAVAVPIAKEFMEWYFGEKEEGEEEK
jgi:penicillin-binding protein 2